MDMHKGVWQKTAKGCHEVRGKTLGMLSGLRKPQRLRAVCRDCRIRSYRQPALCACRVDGHEGYLLRYVFRIRRHYLVLKKKIDVIKTLALGNSQPQPDLDSLLTKADFVTLHVPLSPTTENLISEAQLAKMKKGSYLLNASRGTVVRLLSRLAVVQLLMLRFVQVNIPDLAKALQSGHLAGACASVTPSPCM